MTFVQYLNRNHQVQTTSQVWLVLWLVLAFTCKSNQGQDLYSHACSHQLAINNEKLLLCLSNTSSQDPIKSTFVCPEGNFMLTNLSLHLPKDNIKDCPGENSVKLEYNMTLNASCLMRTNKEELKRLLMPVMEGFSYKKTGQVNSSLVSKIVQGGSFRLPEYTLLDFDYICVVTEKIQTYFMEICDENNRTNSGIKEAHIFFNKTSYLMNTFDSVVCSCQITSQSNTSEDISIRLIDVRLTGSAFLSLSGTKQRTSYRSGLFWWQDDVLESSDENFVIELNRINASQLPDAAWIQVTGPNFTVTCGNYSRQGPDWEHGGTVFSSWCPNFTVTCGNYSRQGPDWEHGGTVFSSWYVPVLGIMAGLLVLGLLAFCLWRCVCKRHQVSTTDYNVVSTGIAMTPSNPHVPKDQCTEGVESNDYFEVEPNCAKACSNFGASQDFLNTTNLGGKYQQDPTGTGQQENIYSHLRQAADTSALTNLYDTVECDEYSTLHREDPKPIIDNIYNT